MVEEVDVIDAPLIYQLGVRWGGGGLHVERLTNVPYVPLNCYRADLILVGG